MVSDWIWSEANLEPLLKSVAFLAGYDLLPDEIIALRYGVADSNAEQDHWYEYEFPGKERVKLRLGRDVGTDVLHVRIDCSDAFKPVAETLVFVFQVYRVRAT